ncbi:hypothetical protein SRHO_G00013440 [Serrasalmus rhombeus]
MQRCFLCSVSFKTDENECELEEAICGKNTVCYNIVGSYYCQCGTGYRETSGKVNFTLSNNECRVIAETELRIVVIGSSGPSQFLLTNYILGREAFTEDVCSIAGCRKNVGELAGRQVAVVNAPNLYDKELSKSKMREELRRTKCLSSPGPHAILIAFDLEKISPNDIQTPKLVMKHFGESVLNYAMVLLAYDGHLGGTALNDRIMKTDWHLRELIEQCNCRYHIFSKNWRNRSKDRELLQKLERMIGDMGGRCYWPRGLCWGLQQGLLWEW